MTDEAFLRAIIASPWDDTPRLIYADWLEERGDPRAELLRQDWNLPRLSFIEWNWVQEHLGYYLDRHPELRSELNEHESNSRWRDGVKALGSVFEPDWLVGSDVLRALKVSDFRSQHIQTLDAPGIPYHGYHPSTENDEIHNDRLYQCLFPCPQNVLEANDEGEENGNAARQAVLDALRGAVVDGQLGYVLLHSRACLPACPWYRSRQLGPPVRGRSISARGSIAWGDFSPTVP